MLAALPAEVEAVVACVENVIESRRDLVRGAPRLDTRSGRGPPAPGVRRPALGPDLGHRGAQPHAHRLGVGGAGGALPGKRDHLVALGAFGSDPAGRPLAEVTRGLKVALNLGSSLAHSLDTGEVQSVSFDEAEPARALPLHGRRPPQPARWWSSPCSAPSG